MKEVFWVPSRRPKKKETIQQIIVAGETYPGETMNIALS